jgi:hypothetical protein
VSIFRVILHFDPEGPKVTGEWAVEETALRCFRSWVGLYGSAAGVRITLVEEPAEAGGGTVLRTWPAPELPAAAALRREG